MSFNVADLLYCEDNDEYLLLIERKLREHQNGTDDDSWDMVDLETGTKFWEWEYVLLDSGCYVRVA